MKELTFRVANVEAVLRVWQTAERAELQPHYCQRSSSRHQSMEPREGGVGKHASPHFRKRALFCVTPEPCIQQSRSVWQRSW
jgi:hypothetical protein